MRIKGNETMDGLKFKVSSSELRSLLLERATYYRNLALEKESSLPDLRKAVDTVKVGRNAANMAIGLSKSPYHIVHDAPLGAFEQDVQNYREIAKSFSFLAEHLFDEDYVLREDDLVRLGIIKSF
jgi:hypothetical protein